MNRAPATPSVSTSSPTSPTFDERVMAGASYLSPFLGMPIIVPCILLLWKRKESPFVAFHAAQALIFSVLHIPLTVFAFLATLAVGAAGGEIAQLSHAPQAGGIILAVTMLVAYVALAVVICLPIGAGISALRGRGWSFPVVASWSRQIVESAKTVA